MFKINLPATRYGCFSQRFNAREYLSDGSSARLADWEAAFTSDRYSDLAIVANFVVTNETDEAAFLTRYFRREATKYELARFYLMPDFHNR